MKNCLKSRLSFFRCTCIFKIRESPKRSHCMSSSPRCFQTFRSSQVRSQVVCVCARLCVSLCVSASHLKCFAPQSASKLPSSQAHFSRIVLFQSLSNPKVLCIPSVLHLKVLRIPSASHPKVLPSFQASKLPSFQISKLPSSQDSELPSSQASKVHGLPSSLHR